MTDEKIIDKIKKLLELAASPNENEAKLAYNRAKDLMAKYSVSLADTENRLQEILQEIYTVPPAVSPILYEHLPYIIMEISRPFGVFVLVFGAWYKRSDLSGGIKLVGFKTNIEVAKHAVDCILNQCIADYRAEYRKQRSVSFAPAFWKGVASALQDRFKQDESSETGLVVYDPVRQFMNKFVASQHMMGGSNLDDAFNAGKQSATNAQIRPGVQSNFTGGLLK
jgi:hypothetical protein